MSDRYSQDLYWLTESVGVPQQLIDALNSNSLVIFAGAGVSIGSPSNLPDFTSLTQILANEADEYFEPKTEIAQFLGGLSRTFDVHGRTHQIFSNPNSEPNDLHTSIIRLAASANDLRIVTTNYDNHFATTASRLNIDLRNQWFAPALPIGSTFSGLVHLHGSILRPPNELVLTDRDMGSAYLFDAWATRFLIRMFETFTVLFVGYSHNDPMMRYLGLALSSKLPRYAFVLESDTTNDLWNRLNICPIGYRAVSENRLALPVALESWASLTRMGTMDNKAKMDEIVKSTLPLRPVDSSYLKLRIFTDDGIEDFVNATSVLDTSSRANWLEWAASQDVFRRMFDDPDLSESSRQFAHWFSDNFVAQPELSDLALQLVQRLGTTFNANLFRACVFAVDKLNKVDAARATRWKALLGTSIVGHTLSQGAQYLFGYPSRTSECEITTVLNCLVPHLKLQQGIYFDANKRSLPHAEISLALNDELLTPVIKSLVESFDPQSSGLMISLENALLLSYTLLDAWNSNPKFDGLSFRRSAIEVHDQDQFRSALDSVIDGLRDLGLRSIAISTFLAERWWDYGRGLFRRLAVYLVSQDDTHTADEKISWILNRGAIFDHDTKHEVYDLLRRAITDASADIREKLVAVVVRGPAIIESNEASDDLYSYEIFNLLTWINDVAPEWGEVSQALEKIQTANPTFRRREHPDFEHWTNPISASEIPSIPLDDMRNRLKANPADAVDWIRTFDDHALSFTKPSWNSALASLTQVVALEPQLGKVLLRNIELKGMKDAKLVELFSAVLDGWSGAKFLSPLSEYLPEISKLATIESVAHSVSRLLLRLVENEQQHIDSTVLNDLRSVCLGMWKLVRDSFKLEPNFNPLTITPLYLNSWPGLLANFVIFSISRRWSSERESWSGLDEVESNLLTLFLDESHDTFKSTLPAIARHLFFLYNADAKFVITTVLPFFGSTSFRNLAWNPFLHSPRVNLSLLNDGFLKCILDSYPSLDLLEDDQLVEQFLMMTFDICSFVPIRNEDRCQLLNSSVISNGGMFTTGFATQTSLRLVNGKVNGAEVWDLWLAEHVARRLKGIPRNASSSELEAWADVVPLVGSRIEVAIELFTGSKIGLSDVSGYRIESATIERFGTQLVNFYADRIRHSVSASATAKTQVAMLIRTFTKILGEGLVEPMVQAASEQRFDL